MPTVLRAVCTTRISGVQMFFTRDEPEITLYYSAFDFLSGLTNFPLPIKISVIVRASWVLHVMDFCLCFSDELGRCPAVYGPDVST